jgi:hypothetical protein
MEMENDNKRKLPKGTISGSENRKEGKRERETDRRRRRRRKGRRDFGSMHIRL